LVGEEDEAQVPASEGSEAGDGEEPREGKESSETEDPDPVGGAEKVRYAFAEAGWELAAKPGHDDGHDREDKKVDRGGPEEATFDEAVVHEAPGLHVLDGRWRDAELAHRRSGYGREDPSVLSEPHRLLALPIKSTLLDFADGLEPVTKPGCLIFKPRLFASIDQVTVDTEAIGKVDEVEDEVAILVGEAFAVEFSEFDVSEGRFPLSGFSEKIRPGGNGTGGPEEIEGIPRTGRCCDDEAGES
jgi:hypothetical protein